MDARNLSLEDREKFKQALINRQKELYRVLDRMKKAGWFTDDPAFQAVTAAYAAIRAAVTYVGGLPPEVKPKPGPWAPTYDREIR